MAESKKAVVTSVAANGTWESNYGTMYKFEIAFDNNDAGEYSSKSNAQDKFVQGQEAEYTITSREYNGNTYYTIKPVTNFQGGNGYKAKVDPEKDKRIAKLAVLKSATELVCHDKALASDLLAVADKMLAWVYSDSKPTTPAVQPSTPPVQQTSNPHAPTNPQEAFGNDNDLPF